MNVEEHQLRAHARSPLGGTLKIEEIDAKQTKEMNLVTWKGPAEQYGGLGIETGGSPS